MDKQISESIKIGIDLMIAASLIAVVAVFAYFSYSMYGTKLHHDGTVALLKDKTVLYDYDNRTVSGSDIIDVVTDNVRVYQFTIKTSYGTYIISPSAEMDYDYNTGKPYGLRLWSDGHIREDILKETVFSKFNAKLVKNNTQDVITGVIFVQEGVN